MCPEFYKTQPRGAHEVSLNLCRANNMDVIPETEIERTCRHNCMSCYLYQYKHGRKPPSMVPQYDTNPKSSGSWMAIAALGIIAYFIAKVVGIL